MTRRRRLAGAGLVWVGSFAALRLTLLAPEDCPDETPEAIEEAALGAAAWIERNQREDGRYVYEYDRDADRVLPGYNIVRHAGVTMSLYQLARAGRPEVLDAADNGLALMLDDLVPAGGGMAFVEPGASQARLGASALMTAALAQRRDATGDERYDDELRALGRFMDGQISTGGQMLALFDLQTDGPVAGETSRYATGEAAWAFAQLHNLFPGEGWDVPAVQVVDYLATARDEVEGLAIPPWADQWAAYALGEMASWGLEEDHVSYAHALSGRFGMLLRVESQKSGWPLPFVDHRARGAGLGVWVEGLGGLATASARDDRLADLRTPLEARMACGAGILVERQQDERVADASVRPELVEGAWFRDGITRMDDQQHVLSALLVTTGGLGPVGR